MATAGPCPLWEGGVECPTSGDFKEIENRRAGGRYRITRSANITLTNNYSKELAAKLTTWIVDQHRYGEPVPTITVPILETVAARRRLNIPTQIDRFFLLLDAKDARADFAFTVASPIATEKYTADDADLCAWMECSSYYERKGIIDLLAQENLISIVSGQARMTPAGVRRLVQLQSGGSTSNQAFIAMWFDKTMAGVSENGFEAAIRAAGYKPMRIDKKEHNNKIDDEIVAEIRRSKFVVADFTCETVKIEHSDHAIARGGVYFEAGFAMGLGLPVIWCCRADLINHVHFDTRQFAHVVWTDEGDLQKKLFNRISAVIGATADAPGLQNR